jgi:signal transduction histidine kinase
MKLPSKLFRPLVIVVLALIYFAAARAGLSMAFVAVQVTVVWPPSGIAVAALLLYGRRMWPGVLLGAFFDNVIASEPVWVAATIAGGNTLEAVVAATLVGDRSGFDRALDRLRDVLRITIWGAAVSPIVAATIGAASLCMSGVQPWSRFGELWSVWWIGDGIGVILVAPLLLTWSRRSWSVIRSRKFEALALSLLSMLMAYIIFFEEWVPFSPRRSLQYAVFPIVIWAAFRFGPMGVAFASVATCAAAVVGTLHGFGPFTAGNVQESLVLLQMFMGVVSVTGLVLATAIQERARAEEELKAADRRKDEFLAMLAHELRNPLAPIRNALHVLSTSPAESGNRMKDLVGVMSRQVDHLVRLVDDLLDASRIIQEKVQFRPETVRLMTVIERARETFDPAITSSKHQLLVEHSEEPLWVHCDVTRMAQVFGNLLNNAAKYSEPGSLIVVSTERCGNNAIVRVRDKGAGIDPAHLPRIFDLFYQSDNSLERSRGGLGIGLTVVRNVVEMHGGSVTAHSEGQGRGTEFCVTLPLTEQPHQLPSPEVKAAPDMPCIPTRIVVVDDNKDSVETLCIYLGMSGYETTPAHTGPEAMEMVSRVQPHVVLLDIGLPGMNGYEVAKWIRSRPRLSEVVLIALTGYGQDEDRRRCEEAGFNLHFVKPVDLDRLQASIHSLLSPKLN